MTLFSYTNHYGRTYYLHQRHRADGTTLYLMRASMAGALGALPDDLEVRENIYGSVSVRRRRARQISDIEAELMSAALRQSRPFAYRLDIDGRAATIFASADDRLCFNESLEAEFAEGFAQVLRTVLATRYSSELIEMFRARRDEAHGKRLRYYPVLRFVLADRKQRLFSVERVCFTGERSWIRLATLSLPGALMKYLPHLGRDSFFDLL